MTNCKRRSTFPADFGPDYRSDSDDQGQTKRKRPAGAKAEKAEYSSSGCEEEEPARGKNSKKGRKFHKGKRQRPEYVSSGSEYEEEQVKKVEENQVKKVKKGKGQSKPKDDSSDSEGTSNTKRKGVFGKRLDKKKAATATRRRKHISKDEDSDGDSTSAGSDSEGGTNRPKSYVTGQPIAFVSKDRDGPIMAYGHIRDDEPPLPGMCTLASRHTCD